MVNARRTIKLSIVINELEAGALAWLCSAEARTESEMVRELIREAADQAGYMKYLEVLRRERAAELEAA